MPNTLELAGKFVPIIDQIYKANSKTEGMDAGARVDFTGVAEVKVLKVSTTGLGDYSRKDGYPKGDITAVWETMKLTEERGAELSIDRMDNEEMLGLAFGEATGKFMRNCVIPELDAVRFARYASEEGISTTDAAILTKETILAAIDEAKRKMDADEVPEEGRILYINSDLQPLLNNSVTRTFGSDGTVNTILNGYNGMRIVYVPRSRFYTAIETEVGVEAWGFKPAEGAAQINFIMIHPEAILQVKKFALPKIFSPDVNQDKDMWKFQFRLYHDALVYDNKVNGIYLHKAA